MPKNNKSQLFNTESFQKALKSLADFHTAIADAEKRKSALDAEIKTLIEKIDLNDEEAVRIADQLKHALATYTESGGQGDPTFDTAQAIAVMLEKHGIACNMLHGFHWDKWTTGKPAERLSLIPAGQEHILGQEDGKKRFVQVVTELSRAFALCAASDEATEIHDDVSFFQAIQAGLSKQTPNGKKSPNRSMQPCASLCPKRSRRLLGFAR